MKIAFLETNEVWNLKLTPSKYKDSDPILTAKPSDETNSFLRAYLTRPLALAVLRSTFFIGRITGTALPVAEQKLHISQ